MKTRIISGVIMGVIVAGVLALGLLWHPVIITLAIAVLAGGAAYEMVHNAATIKSKAANIIAVVFSFCMVFALDFERGYATFLLNKLFGMGGNVVLKVYVPFALGIFYFLFAVCIVLKNHRDFGLGQIGMLCGVVFPLSFAFNCLNLVIRHQNGLYYLLLMFVFSSVCDMGAYFTGVSIGKHKLCPEISPKKTVEGAVGGMVSSMIFVIVLMLLFRRTPVQIVATVIFTIPLCIVGMLGDLFASAIKRSVDLKDYGNLIPGHGGIMDRLDSMLLIAPLLYVLIVVGLV
ncbi:MAG: phosphatidate cytidylyltransferase [Clostridia bacterium]|nr:phosphatidate cytidylyltransferase [Clostridia bacterium]